MPTEIVAMVLVAALAHASWNALIKSDDDRLVTLGAINAVRFLLCIPIVLALPLPDRASWPYLAASSILHVGYYIFLISAYRFGDLSKVYPLARGLSPLIVAAGAYAFAGERLSPMALVGVAVACMGIASLSLGGGATPARSARVHAGALSSAGDGAAQARTNRRGVVFAAGTAVFIAAYTVTDAMGARLSGHAVSYVAWLSILDGLPMLLVAGVLRPRRAGPPSCRSRVEISGRRRSSAHRVRARGVVARPRADGRGLGAARDERPVRRDHRGEAPGRAARHAPNHGGGAGGGGDHADRVGLSALKLPGGDPSSSGGSQSAGTACDAGATRLPLDGAKVILRYGSGSGWVGLDQRDPT